MKCTFFSSSFSVPVGKIFIILMRICYALSSDVVRLLRTGESFPIKNTGRHCTWRKPISLKSSLVCDPNNPGMILKQVVFASYGLLFQSSGFSGYSSGIVFSVYLSLFFFLYLTEDDYSGQADKRRRKKKNGSAYIWTTTCILHTLEQILGLSLNNKTLW